MESPLINTREDLNAIVGTIEYDVFMDSLRGSIYRLERDDTVGVWRAVEDTTTIERFGFTRGDFPNATPPALPVYISPEPKEPEYRINRRAEYPSIGDQLDALYHAGVYPTEMAALIDAVKIKYPKA